MIANDTAARRRSNAAWLRTQIEGLVFVLAVRDVPNKELRQALACVLEGDDWRAVMK